ncbi:MAG: SLBB domain-containing protein, partial [Mariprofundaceae bacterium]|nr:SLBB domain-containing protein [Mariprofundaceae bacterium]
MCLKNIKRFFISYVFLLCLGSIVSINTAQALQLSAAQLQMVQQLSPSEKAKLAQQVGVSNVAPTRSNTPVTGPENIKPRALGSSPVEAKIKHGTVDVAQQNAEIQSSVKVDVPVVKVASQVSADQLELRKSFADFVAESKPLTVDTSHLQQFGYALFAGSPSTFAPATDIPVPAEYVLGPGDELNVQLFGAKSDQFKLLIDREGVVAFPNIGPITLAGMNFSNAKALLAQAIGKKMVGVSASVNMGKLRSIRIFALGEVSQPGSYVVSGLATLSQALMVSGGVKKTGSLRTIQLKRRGKLITTIDLYDFLLKGDTSKDVRLLPGDVVFVPPIGMTASIAGAVLRPAIYELKDHTNVAQLIHLAGGLLPKAYINKATIEGMGANKKNYVKNIALKKHGLKTSLHNGDILKVFSTLDFEENPVLLIGNVKRPGKYAWSQGMHLSNLLATPEALLPETYMDYGIIERETKGNREPEIKRFSLKELFQK